MARDESSTAADLRARTQRFVEERLIPFEYQYVRNERVDETPYVLGPGEHFFADPKGPVPPDLYREWVQAAQQAGLWGLDVPKEYGGQGVGVAEKMAVIEELGRTPIKFRPPPDAPNLHWLIESANDDQRERYLLPLARGEKSSWLNLTEEGAGSDVAGIETIALKVDGGWVLDGNKKWVNGSDYVDFCLILAVTDREKGTRGGLTAFIVDRGTPGFEVVRRIPTITMTLQQVEIHDMFLSDAQVLGAVGWGFTPLTNRLSIRRLEVVASSIGATKRILGMMIERANSRMTFGKPLAERQTVRNWIADTWVQLYAVEEILGDITARVDSGQVDVRLQAGAGKMLASEMLYQATDRAMQLHGALGMSKDTPLELFWRGARAARVAEGASEIQRDFTARELLRHGVPDGRC